MSRGLSAAAGLSLMARGAAGHCGMKAALTGETSLRQGMQEQWERMRSRLAGTAAGEIDSMVALYTVELQELHSAEFQLCSVLQRLAETLPDFALERELKDYGTEVRARREDLERILASSGANPRQHPDQAMHALLRETRKMTHVAATNVRTAALIASLQRLIHYKIAGYGAVATYAKTLGRTEEAARLAGYADRDKSVDQALSSIAIELVNPRAQVQPGVADDSAAARPH